MTNNNPGRALLLLCALGISLIALCSTPSVTGGASGSEVSAFVGTVIDSDGNPIEDALVRLRPASFLSDSGRSATYKATHSIIDTLTGSDGAYGFAHLIPDSYTVEVVCNDTINMDTLGSLTQLRIEHDDPLKEIPPLIITPQGKISGKVKIEYDKDASVFIQTFGLDRSAEIDVEGNFSMRVPRGAHRLHIAAYQNQDTTRSQEFDGIDLSLNVGPGEQRDAGSFSLRSAPPPPCKNGSCDISTIRAILDASGNASVSLDNIITTSSKGRVIALNLGNLDLSAGISDDIVQLTELRYLDLSNTGLIVLFHNIGRLTHLEVVRLGGNKLSFFSSTIGSLKSLQELDLADNELTDLPASIVNCVGLSEIDVSGNKLCSIEPAIAEWLNNRSQDWGSSQHCQ